jgi:hypothetical protein
MNAARSVQSNRKSAIWVGLFFLIAMMASLLGGGLVSESISAPDFYSAVSENQTVVIVGALLEIVNGLAVLGIGILMFSVLRKHTEGLAVGYLGFRIVEAVFCCFFAITPLALIKLSQTAIASESSAFMAAGSLSIAERAVIGDLFIPVFLSLGGFLLYSAFYKSGLLPRFIAVWGLIAAALILILNLLLTFNIEVGFAVSMVFALPIILNEVFLGFWLIIKGFNPSAIPAGKKK